MVFKPIAAYQVLWICLVLPALAHAETLTLPDARRPEWLSRDGIVMAGSWEPLFFRVRRDGVKDYTPTPEQLAAYRREHGPRMIAQLKALGVNFVMMHCYKGAGLQAERGSMADAVRFAGLCHDAGLRVGVYNYSGTLLTDFVLKEVPQATDWVLRDPRGRGIRYSPGAAWRLYWNRNHPDAVAYHKKLIAFAIQDVRADLIHFDNYVKGPAYDATSARQFRDYLRKTFTRRQLEAMGAADLESVRPPVPGADPPSDAAAGLHRAWLRFSCDALAESYKEMSRHARTLRPDVLVECNPRGIGPWIQPPVDHGSLVGGGEAFWDEGEPSGFQNGKLQTAIRTYKAGRRMGNMVFRYAVSPIELAEAMAFNRDCLGCICWFEYGKITNYPGVAGRPVAPEIGPFVRFFHQRRELFRRAEPIADVAVLRSFPSQVFGPDPWRQMTHDAEKTLLENRFCFDVLYDRHLDELHRYRAVVLAGCGAMSQEHVDRLKAYVAAGGRLCVVGPLAEYDEWMTRRKVPALDDLRSAQVVRLAERADLAAALRGLNQDDLSLAVGLKAASEGKAKSEASPRALRPAPLGLCVELTGQPGRRLVHLVNYRDDGPIENVAVELRLPPGATATSVVLADPQQAADVSIPFHQHQNRVELTIPRILTYTIASITFTSQN